MGEYNGSWTANLNTLEPVELTFVPKIPDRVSSSTSTGTNRSVLSYAENQDLDQRIASNRPSSSRINDLMRPRVDTPVPFHNRNLNERKF